MQQSATIANIQFWQRAFLPLGRVLDVAVWPLSTEANNEASDGFRRDTLSRMDERLDRRLAAELAKKSQGDSGKRYGLWMDVPVWSCEPSRSASRANQPRGCHISFSLGNAMVAAQASITVSW